MHLVRSEARPVGLHQEAANTALFLFHPCPDHGYICDVAGRDPHLLAIENVLIADFSGRGSHAPGVGSEARLGQAEAAQHFSARQRREPRALLFVRAESVNGIHDQGRLDADEAAKPRVTAFQFLHHQPIFHVRHSGTAVALKVSAEEPEFTHHRHQFAWETAFTKAVLDDGDQVIFDKIACGSPNQQFVFAETGIAVKKVNALKFEAHDLPASSKQIGNSKASRLRGVVERLDKLGEIQTANREPYLKRQVSLGALTGGSGPALLYEVRASIAKFLFSLTDQ